MTDIQAPPFRAPVDDILFSLKHVARADRLSDWDGELASEVITHFASFAEERIAPLNASGDVEGCRLENGRVKMPEGFAEVYRELAEQGWQGISAPETHGGQSLNHTIVASVCEIFAGANHSLQMVAGLVPGAISTLVRFGTGEQQQRLIPPLVDGRWLATMALTEPGSGSDLSTIRTRATRDGDAWRIDGEKIFISGGDQDISEGILHLVLARTGSMEEGSRGLSLFACLSHLPNGERNSVSVTRIEEKLGLHASPTCQLAFDGAGAELVGELGMGLKAMFALMNHARLDVALQGVAHAARGADLARRYAAERLQGRDRSGQPVTIDQHADVARMIEEADAWAVGGRALGYLTMVEGELTGGEALLSFMTPICKWLCTEGGIRGADLAIQVMGGYGYLREFGAEQNWRDARICAIYEGANGIHALTNATRSLKSDGGAGAAAFVALLRESGSELHEQAHRWEAEARRIASMSDPSAEAHDFMRLTATSAWLAVWARIKKVAEATENARYLQLAKRAATMSL